MKISWNKFYYQILLNGNFVFSDVASRCCLSRRKSSVWVTHNKCFVIDEFKFFSDTSCNFYPVTLYQNADLVESVKTTISTEPTQCAFAYIDDKLSGPGMRNYVVKHGASFVIKLKGPGGWVQTVGIFGPTTISCSYANNFCNPRGTTSKAWL